MAYSIIDCPKQRNSPRTGDPVKTLHRVAALRRKTPPKYRCDRCKDHIYRVQLGQSTFWGTYVIEEEP